MKLEKYRHPFIYFGISVLGSAAFFFTAAGISHSSLMDNPGWFIFASIIGLFGLLVPMVTALVLILPDRDMREELKSACLSFKGISWKWWAYTFFFPFAAVLLAQAISLLLGRSAEQFKLAENFSFSAGIIPVWFLFLIVPVIEELGWRTYGSHCIRRSFNLFTTCFIFGIIWMLWHFPLSFIKGYYHENLAETGILYSINYNVSLIPYLILDNWCFYKTRRNLFIQFATHMTFNFSMEIFPTHPDSKVIHTVLLCIFSVVIVLREKKFFFDKSFDEVESPESVS
jgi:membrane protease YdiL (CAAX protease family)